MSKIPLDKMILLEQWLQSVFYNFQVGHEDIERHSKIKKNDKGNENTIRFSKSKSFSRIDWSWLGTVATVSIIFFEEGHMVVAYRSDYVPTHDLYFPE